MEAQESMILRDMPVETRNYIIIDNITGKPIDQSNYTLSIDSEVIGKLNKLKKINEEKVKQAALRDKYGNTNIASTFTPKDNAVFTPVYNDEYIDYQDFNTNDDVVELVDTTENEEEIENTTEEIPVTHAEVIKSDTLLDRVVARDPSARMQAEEEQKVEEEPKEELDYISNYVPADEDSIEQSDNQSQSVDNSVFTPEMAGLQQASEQIVNIDTDKLGQDIKTHKEAKKGTERIKLDKMEVISGKKVAWMAYILFFIPLLFKKNNRYVRMHANEGLELNIMELISGLLVGQYYLLPKLMESMSSTLSMISFVGCMIGAGLLGACLLTCVISLIGALFGNQHQTPWLWKRRMIHVPTERTSDR